MNIHFVYSVPFRTTKAFKIFRKILTHLQIAGLPVSLIGNRAKLNSTNWPHGSPYSITKNLYNFFSSKCPTNLYHLTERIRIHFEKDDIFLGHPTFPYVPGIQGVTELSLDSKIRPLKLALISPLHCNIECKSSHINKQYLDAIDQLISKVDVLLSIMGQYWWDQWDYSPYSHWKPKMIRLDMAIDTTYFPTVKKKFNPPGKRGYLFIGRNDPMKGPDFLNKLFENLPGLTRGWIGDGEELPAVPRISYARPLTPNFMEQIAERYDFFITTGIADPNPTTILESMAWGFPVICTPQSGYYENECITNIYHDNIDRSIDVINNLQYLEENKLNEMAKLGGRLVREEYTWKKFITTVSAGLEI